MAAPTDWSGPWRKIRTQALLTAGLVVLVGSPLAPVLLSNPTGAAALPIVDSALPPAEMKGALLGAAGGAWPGPALTTDPLTGSPASAADALTVRYTLFPANDSLLRGDVVPPRFQEPRFVAYDSAANRVFADGSGPIFVLDPSNLRVTGQLGSLSAGNLVYLSAADILYIESGGALDALNPSTGALETSIPVAQATTGPDGTLVYVPTQNEFVVGSPYYDTVAIVSLSAGKVVTNVTVGNSINNVLTGTYDPVNQDVYLADYEDNRVEVLDPASWSIITNVSIPAGDGLFATGIVADSDTGNVFVSSLFYCPGCSGSDSLVEISGANNSVVASRGLGSYTSGIAYSGGTLYVADSRSANLYAIDASNLSKEATVSLPNEPAFIYDQWWPVAIPSLGVVIVGEGDSEAISEVSTGSLTVVATDFAVVELENVMADAACACEVVSDGARQLLYFVDPLTFHVEFTAPLQGRADDMAYDGATQQLFVTLGGLFGTQGIEVLYGTNGTERALIKDSNSPWGITIDPGNGAVYVADYFGDDVSVYSGTTLAQLARVRAGNQTTAITYVPEDDSVYATNWGSNNVTRIDAGTNSVVGTIHVGAAPTSILYDAHAGELLVGCVSSGNITRINLTAQRTEGALSLPGVQSMAVNASTGDVYVANSSHKIFIVNGTTGNVSNLSVGAGSYGLLVAGGDLLVTDPIAGAIYQVGPPVSGSIFLVEAAESGLPAGTSWTVDLSNGDHKTTTAGAMSWEEANGSYTYTVSSTNRSWDAAGGSFPVDGTPVRLSVNFSEVLYGVDFSESGLPDSFAWVVTLGQTNGSSTNGTIEFQSPNGTFTFTVAPIQGYTTSNATQGSVFINGAPKAVHVVYQVAPKTKGPPGSQGPNSTSSAGGKGWLSGDTPLLLGAGVIALALIGVGFALRRRRRPAPVEPTPES